MHLNKRIFDLLVAITLSIVLLPVILAVAVLVLLLDGWPIFYVSERMKTPSEGFWLIKFRTMALSLEDSGVTGGDKSNRVFLGGQFLRNARLDELPQLWNVLRGDLSFVGPRPPLRQYVERFPNVYARVLESRPGITGLASVYFHSHEEKLLSRCSNVDETDAIYSRICVPRKARLDIIYQQHRSICMDVAIMMKTVFKNLR